VNRPTGVKVWIPGHPPGGNERKRWHWRKLKKIDDQYMVDAHRCGVDAVNRSGVTGLPYGQCHVVVEFHYTQKRTRDWDNLVGQLKPILDGLRGILWIDDSTDHILTLRPELVIGAGRGPGILVYVEPVQQSLF
jgi:hypothetical protein